MDTEKWLRPHELGSLIKKWQHPGSSLLKSGTGRGVIAHAEQGGRISIYRNNRARFMLYSWAKETALANHGRSSLYRGAAFRP